MNQWRPLATVQSTETRAMSTVCNEFCLRSPRLKAVSPAPPPPEVTHSNATYSGAICRISVDVMATDEPTDKQTDNQPLSYYVEAG